MRIGKRVRHLQRYREIAVAFVRNGFGYIANELGFPETIPFFGKERKDIHKKTLGQRIRLLLEDLGPTFVKLGQIGSTRPDLIPADIISELVKLQNNVPVYPFEEARKLIEDELGGSVDSLFSYFSQSPFAAASIGQVYRASLIDGTEVAVKVQRPHIESTVETDLDILAELARQAENRLEWARRYRLQDIVEEIGKAMRAELNYTNEARQADKFILKYGEEDNVCVPRVYWDYTTKRVLTMEFMDGIPLSDVQRLEEEGHQLQGIAKQLATVILDQILIEGFFHGDPHPGNVMALSDGRLALLDFGQVGKLSPDMRDQLALFIIALRNESTKGMIRSISAMGFIPESVDMGQLRADVDAMREQYYNTPLSRISLGEAIHDLFELAFRHQIEIPSELTMLGKTLLTLEGVVARLDPSFSVLEVAEPYGKRLFRERFDPRKIVRKIVEEAPEFIDMMTELPSSIKHLSAVMRKGKLRMEANIPELAAFYKSLNRIGSKLAFSIVLLSFSIILVGLIIGSTMRSPDSIIWNLPVFEIGFSIAFLMIAWMLYVIIRWNKF